jgi:cellulose synthase/poly-beta-1,6-N-acetylglucosamine synthase-like glycosyltransferase
VRVLARQRNRWHRGLVQTLWAHRGMMLNPRVRRDRPLRFSLLRCFEMLGPFVETLGYLVVLLSFFLGVLDLQFLLLFVAAAGLYGIFLSVSAVLLEEMSFRRYPGWVDLTKLLVFAVLENLGYRQMLAFFKVRAFLDVVRRRRTWGRMDRTGFGEPLPASADR